MWNMSISLKIIGLKCFSSKSICKSMLVFPIEVRIKATETSIIYWSTKCRPRYWNFGTFDPLSIYSTFQEFQLMSGGCWQVDQGHFFKTHKSFVMSQLILLYFEDRPNALLYGTPKYHNLFLQPWPEQFSWVYMMVFGL